jgi:NAD(P)-dependent dehydrogenase (short-subunit alcohol dehydrogenase family)
VNMDKELAGRAAIVTGAGGGIGAAIAVALASAGASVLVADVDAAGASATVTTIEKAGGRALAVKTDVTESAQVRSMVLAAVERLGSADILVNNAGIATADLVESLDEDAWRRVLDVNLTGPFLCCRAVVPYMRARGWGRIVNISSVAAKRISFGAAASYTASKEGLLGFTRHLAYEVARDGINVNAICPGPTVTAMYEKIADEKTHRERLGLVPQGRFMKPEDIGRATVMLCSSLSDAICGVALDVDGGILLGWMPVEEYRAKRRKR